MAERDPEVLVLQKRLKDLNLYSGNVDGDFGPKTLAATLKGLELVPEPAKQDVAQVAAPPLPDLANFFSNVRQKLGPLNASQVGGFESLFNVRHTEPLQISDEWFSYMLATAWHETAATMLPIAEYGKGKGRKYGKPDPRTGLIYYGRGYVQLTWYDNYKLYGIENDPEKALEPKMAGHIMMDGMINGKFTGKKLGDYFSTTKNDPMGARRIINGTDKAKLIAGHYKTFLDALKAA